jgi:hypothetical protein
MRPGRVKRRILAAVAGTVLGSAFLTTGVLASPWQQQITTCLWSNKLLPGHIYVNEKNGNVRCIPD